MRAFLNKGRGYRSWLDADDGRSTKHLAEREGCSRPRICQLLVLTRLAPELQADLDDEARTELDPFWWTALRRRNRTTTARHPG